MLHSSGPIYFRVSKRPGAHPVVFEVDLSELRDLFEYYLNMKGGE